MINENNEGAEKKILQRKAIINPRKLKRKVTKKIEERKEKVVGCNT